MTRKSWSYVRILIYLTWATLTRVMLCGTLSNRGTSDLGKGIRHPRNFCRGGRPLHQLARGKKVWDLVQQNELAKHRLVQVLYNYLGPVLGIAMNDMGWYVKANPCRKLHAFNDASLHALTYINIANCSQSKNFRQNSFKIF